tara:strand:- start:49736 stop:50506 length:771 start_codon:yes stop_codon:yes gene_type:complete
MKTLNSHEILPYTFYLFLIFTLSGMAQTPDALTIDTNGNVGIGTSNPTSKLEVIGSLKAGSAEFNGNVDIGTLAHAATKLEVKTSIANFSGNVVIGTPATNAKLEVNGEVKAYGRIKDKTGYVTPIGGIIMWSGHDTSFDANGFGIDELEGWVKCDGENGTPDLSNRFIVSAGSKYNVTEKGGYDDIILNTDQLPNHSHEYGVGGGYGLTYNTGNGNSQGYPTSKPKWKSNTYASGNGESFDNRPKYYVLYFIMKL